MQHQHNQSYDAFVVPIMSEQQSGQGSRFGGAGQLATPGAPSSSSSHQPPPSPTTLFTPTNNTTSYRHSTHLESGAYRPQQQQQAPPSPATSYASAQSAFGSTNGNRNSFEFDSSSNQGGFNARTGRTATTMAGQGTGGLMLQTQGPQQSFSSQQAPPPPPPSSSTNRLSNVPPPPQSSTMQTPGSSSRRTSSTSRMIYSPNPPSASDLLASPTYPHTSQFRQSTAGNLPPQAGLMRRGMSYDALLPNPNANPAPPMPQDAPIVVNAASNSSASLLPTAYAGRTPMMGPNSPSTATFGSPMTGIRNANDERTSTSPRLPMPPSPSAPSSARLPPPPPMSSTALQQQHLQQQQQQMGHSSANPTSAVVDHSRHPSYSPSQYAAPPQSQSQQPTSNPAAAAFYAHHIPTTQAPPPQSQSQPQSFQPPPQSQTPAHQPQAQQYYQSQQYFDSTIASQSQPQSQSSSIPSTSNSAPPNLTANQYYKGGQELMNLQQQQGNVNRTKSEEATSGFRRVRDTREIPRVVNAQPRGRRADPLGGFVSPLKALTTHLPQTYRLVNPSFKYETSLNPRRVLTKPSKPATNEGFDNEDSDYILYVNDVLGPEEKDRYLILDVLGQGTFGQVVKCQNMKTHEIVAVKVVKNKPAYFQQSMMEVTILELINNQWDKEDEHHMLRLKDTFIHHSHLCLVFELLSNNLYELIKQNSFRGLSTSLVRVFTTQLLDALTVLQEAKIIHCDLKPENILLKSLQSPTIKVIDFGSACHEKQTVYTYIQSRFYRSPEVILSLPYSASIDMWSLGCICVELFLGLPLFPGTSEFNQITRIVEMLGMPPDHMLEKGKQTSHFFEAGPDEYGRRRWRLKSLERYCQEYKAQEQPSKKYFSATTLPEIIKQYPIGRKGLKEAEVDKEMKNRVAFIDFVKGLLHIDPEQRWTPQQARQHPFVLGEPLLAPFVPAPRYASASSKSMPTSPQPDTTKRYGGLPPAPQRSTTRTYQDAKAYNQHLNQQQGYAVQAQQAAQRAAAVPTNPYHVPDAAPYQDPNAQQYGARMQMAAQQQQMQAAQQQQMQAAVIAQQQQNAYANSQAFNYQRGTGAGSSSGLGAATVANPPAVHHYTTRGRSNTITQDLPPALQKLGHDLVQQGTGQSITPVLRRDDQWEAWNRIQSGDGQGVARRVSISRNPHLNLLQEQAESGMNSWQSPMRPKQGQQAYSSYYQSPVQNQQPFSVVVDGRDRQSDLFDPGPIAAPPLAYAAGNPSRYAPYSAGPSQPAQQNAFEVPFDSYNHSDGLATLYTPMQPRQQGSSGQQPPPQLQPSFYSPGVPSSVFPASGTKSKGGMDQLWK